MPIALKWKPDFPATIARFDAWWQGAIVDRPPVTLRVRSQRPVRRPESRHPTLRAHWMDMEYQVAAAIAELEARDWLGDAFPVLVPNLGPEITGTLFGCELEFGEHTSWSKPIIHTPEDWAAIPSRAPDFDNVYWRTIEQGMDLAIAQADGRFVVGMADLHGAYDMLASLREPMHLCTDILDVPELVDAAGRHMAAAYAEAFRRQYARVAAAGFGSTTWCPFYFEGPAYIPSCDFWCMLSPQVADDMILPTLHTEMAPLERSIFHLDGPQALKHLERTLALPGLNALQWVYGDGHGGARDWLNVYRRAQDAGKAIEVRAQDPADALDALSVLRPEGIWLQVSEPFDHPDSAHAFLREVERLSTTRRVTV